MIEHPFATIIVNFITECTCPWMYLIVLLGGGGKGDYDHSLHLCCAGRDVHIRSGGIVCMGIDYHYQVAIVEREICML